MQPDLKGRVALITGGARGIGQACAVALAQCGAEIAVCDLLPMGETVERTKDLKRRCLGKQVDVTHRNELKRFVEETLAFFSKIDTLVTCAAICPNGYVPNREP